MSFWTEVAYPSLQSSRPMARTSPYFTFKSLYDIYKARHQAENHQDRGAAVTRAERRGPKQCFGCLSQRGLGNVCNVQ